MLCNGYLMNGKLDVSGVYLKETLFENDCFTNSRLVVCVWGEGRSRTDRHVHCTLTFKKLIGLGCRVSEALKQRLKYFFSRSSDCYRVISSVNF